MPRPDDSSSFLNSSEPCQVLSAAATLPPARRNPSAIAFPMPRAPPVITATLPSMLGCARSIASSTHFCCWAASASVFATISSSPALKENRNASRQDGRVQHDLPPSDAPAPIHPPQNVAAAPDPPGFVAQLARLPHHEAAPNVQITGLVALFHQDIGDDMSRQ